jgi:hypothetical protein
MANTAANVRVGKPAVSGGVSVADAGTTLPTDATTGLAVGFTAAGYVGEDGVTQTIATDSTDIKAWGGDIVRRVQTSHVVTYKFTLIETNDTTLAVYYGDDNVTAGNVEIKAGDLPHKEWSIDVVDGDNTIRVVIPDGQVTDRGDVVFKDDQAIGYDVTVTAYPDDSGVKAYIYQDS